MTYHPPIKLASRRVEHARREFLPDGRGLGVLIESDDPYYYALFFNLENGDIYVAEAAIIDADGYLANLDDAFLDFVESITCRDVCLPRLKLVDDSSTTRRDYLRLVDDPRK